MEKIGLHFFCNMHVDCSIWVDRIDHESGGGGEWPQTSHSDLSSLTVLGTISRSHNEAQKSHCKQIHKPMEYTSRIFSVLPCTIDFSGINSVEIDPQV